MPAYRKPSYVSITRYFHEAKRKPSKRLRWADLLAPAATGHQNHVALVAASGLGKSEEFRQQALAQRNDDGHAVYCEAPELASGEALNSDENAALSRSGKRNKQPVTRS